MKNLPCLLFVAGFGGIALPALAAALPVPPAVQQVVSHPLFLGGVLVLPFLLASFFSDRHARRNPPHQAARGFCSPPLSACASPVISRPHRVVGAQPAAFDFHDESPTFSLQP